MILRWCKKCEKVTEHWELAGKARECVECEEVVRPESMQLSPLKDREWGGVEGTSNKRRAQRGSRHDSEA